VGAFWSKNHFSLSLYLSLSLSLRHIQLTDTWGGACPGVTGRLGHNAARGVRALRKSYDRNMINAGTATTIVASIGAIFTGFGREWSG
jgi:hypothetical protein